MLSIKQKNNLVNYQLEERYKIIKVVKYINSSYASDLKDKK